MCCWLYISIYTLRMLYTLNRSHRPSAEETGVSGISPKSSFDDVRDTLLVSVAVLALLSPDSERFSVGGGGWSKYMMD